VLCKKKEEEEEKRTISIHNYYNFFFIFVGQYRTGCSRGALGVDHSRFTSGSDP
jgi:hypothetical protein